MLPFSITLMEEFISAISEAVCRWRDRPCSRCVYTRVTSVRSGLGTNYYSNQSMSKCESMVYMEKSCLDLDESVEKQRALEQAEKERRRAEKTARKQAKRQQEIDSSRMADDEAAMAALGFGKFASTKR